MFGRELREVVNLALDDAPAVAGAVVPGDLGVRDEPGGGLRRRILGERRRMRTWWCPCAIVRTTSDVADGATAPLHHTLCTVSAAKRNAASCRSGGGVLIFPGRRRLDLFKSPAPLYGCAGCGAGKTSRDNRDEKAREPSMGKIPCGGKVLGAGEKLVYIYIHDSCTVSLWCGGDWSSGLQGGCPRSRR